jgi:hypothetical protein
MRSELEWLEKKSDCMSHASVPETNRVGPPVLFRLAIFRNSVSSRFVPCDSSRAMAIHLVIGTRVNTQVRSRKAYLMARCVPETIGFRSSVQ